jgi:hypothetical protein
MAALAMRLSRNAVTINHIELQIALQSGFTVVAIGLRLPNRSRDV